MIKFNTAQAAIEFFSERDKENHLIHEVKNYRIGVDDQNKIIVKENNWFNKSWLGRTIDILQGNHFDKKAFYYATEQIVDIANERKSNAKTPLLQIQAKTLQTSLVTLALTKFGKGGLEIVKSLKQHITPGISVDWTPQERTWEEEIIPSLNLPVDPKHLWEEILQIKDYKNLSNYIERMRQKALNEESLSDYEQGYIRIFYTIKEQLMNNMTQERMNALSQAKQQFISTAEKHFDFKDLESKGMVEKEQAMKRLESLAEWINQGLSPRDWKS